MLENRTFHDVGPFANNIYVVTDAATRETAILDVGFEPGKVIELVRREKLLVRWLLATHAHYDHVAAMLPVQQAVGGVFALHPSDRPLLERVELQGSMFGLPPVEVPEVGHDLVPGERVPLGEQSMEVLFTPGHAPGHVTFKHGSTLWSGDVLFAGSVGRTDLPGASWDQLERSIRDVLFPLGDEMKVLPGHGPATTIGAERKSNPFVGEVARP
ncbi:MAG TPA: MBL fold metallo-hydrolase [Verrucomicrobiae bacterium]|jgi:hydroxyacylglutathione hydrolase|nr:MBL fold metallo-hydrolase [Verrucomicrobiae bacterium]